MKVALQRRVTRLERTCRSHLTRERESAAFIAALSDRELARRIVLGLDHADRGLDDDWARMGFQAARILREKD